MRFIGRSLEVAGWMERWGDREALEIEGGKKFVGLSGFYC